MNNDPDPYIRLGLQKSIKPRPQSKGNLERP